MNDAFSLITLLVSLANAIFVITIGIYNAKNDRRIAALENKKRWLGAEVVSQEKINEHLADIAKALEINDIEEACGEIEKSMLDFFYTSINYVKIIDKPQFNKLSTDIMRAVDDIILTLLESEVKLDKKEIDRIIKIYRTKLLNSFYKMGIDMENRRRKNHD